MAVGQNSEAHRRPQMEPDTISMQTDRINRVAQALPRSQVNLRGGKGSFSQVEQMPRENPNNILITEDIINQLLKDFGVSREISDLDLYQTAFVHNSYLIDPDQPDEERVPGAIPLQSKSYERLEYIGDAILNAAAAHYVFLRYPCQDEGFMTTLRTKLVRSKTLARLTRKLKLRKYILLSQYVDHCDGRKNQNTLEDVFEALIGAMYLDFGGTESKMDWSQPNAIDKFDFQAFGSCVHFIVNTFERFIDVTTLIDRDDNYKKNLLEYYQKRFKTEAKYQIISVRGKKNSFKVYTMGALSPTGEIIGIGQARKKVEASQLASKQALLYYGEEVEDSEEDSE